MSRKPNTEERRAQIVDALGRVMATVGYQKATIQLIGSEAGLTPGLIHYHFRNKGEILMALVEKLITVADRREQFYRQKAGNSREEIHAFFEALLALDEGRDPAAVAAWVAVSAEAVRLDEVRILFGRAMAERRRRLIALLEQASTEQETVRDDIPQQATLLLAAVEGIFQLSVTTPDLLPGGFAAPQLIAMVDLYLDGS